MSSVADINDPSKESSDEADSVENRGDGMEDLGDDAFDSGNDEAVETWEVNWVEFVGVGWDFTAWNEVFCNGSVSFSWSLDGSGEDFVDCKVAFCIDSDSWLRFVDGSWGDGATGTLADTEGWFSALNDLGVRSGVNTDDSMTEDAVGCPRDDSLISFCGVWLIELVNDPLKLTDICDCIIADEFAKREECFSASSKLFEVFIVE